MSAIVGGRMDGTCAAITGAWRRDPGNAVNLFG